MLRGETPPDYARSEKNGEIVDLLESVMVEKFASWKGTI